MRNLSKSQQKKDIKNELSKNKSFFNVYFLTGGIVGLLIGLFLPLIFSNFRINFVKNSTVSISPTKAISITSTPTPIKIASPPASLRLPIIMYHYIENVKDPKDVIRQRLDIVPAMFDKQLKDLADNEYQTFFVKDIPDFMKGKKELPEKSIILTFDDGYEDFYLHAFPILKKYQMKATIYIIYNFIGRKGFMTKDEIQELLDSGLIEVGSHTLDHLYLSKTPVKEAHKQIFDSKKNLEDMFNIKIETFAYPVGAFDKQVVDMTKEASYSAAVSVMPGIVQSKDNMFTLYRIRPGVFENGNVVKGLQKYK